MDTITIQDLADSLKGLELLFEYTKFHIGIYLTLTAAYITLATSNVGVVLPKPRPIFAGFAVACFMAAGLAGGIIVSSITQCECSNVNEFFRLELGPWQLELFTAKSWTFIEHTSFWIGLIAAALSLTFPKNNQQPLSAAA